MKYKWQLKLPFILIIILITLIFIKSRMYAEVKGVFDIKQGVPVLLYHRVEDAREINNGKYDVTMAVTPSEFKAQMQYLKNHGYNTITYDQLYNFMVNGAELPYKPIVITFDDGYYSNYKYAYRILRILRMRAEIAAVTGVKEMDESPELLKREDKHFNWKEALQMQSSGVIDIQSHTVEHKSLAQLLSDELKKELFDSKRSIETKLNKSVNTIVYPNGSYNQRVIKEAKNVGYRMGVTISPGLNYYKGNVMEVKRYIVSHGQTGQGILNMIK